MLAPPLWNALRYFLFSYFPFSSVTFRLFSSILFFKILLKWRTDQCFPGIKARRLGDYKGVTSTFKWERVLYLDYSSGGYTNQYVRHKGVHVKNGEIWVRSVIYNSECIMPMLIFCVWGGAKDDNTLPLQRLNDGHIGPLWTIFSTSCVSLIISK